jgi:uncharacterized protein
MLLRVAPDRYSIVQLPADAGLPAWAGLEDAGFVSATRTRGELSLVVKADAVPAGVTQAGDRRLIEVVVTHDLDEPGITARLTTALAAAGLGLCVIGTYATDHLLVEDRDLAAAQAALLAAGCTFAE